MPGSIAVGGAAQGSEGSVAGSAGTLSDESSNESTPVNDSEGVKDSGGVNDSGGATHSTGLAFTSNEVEPLYRTRPGKCQERDAAVKKEKIHCRIVNTKKRLSFIAQGFRNASQSRPSRASSPLTSPSSPAGPPRVSASLASSSMINNATPTTMKLSARLKSGHW